MASKRERSLLKRSADIFNERTGLHKIKSEIENIIAELFKLRSTLRSHNIIREVWESGGATSFEKQKEHRKSNPYINEPHDTGLKEDA